MFVFKYWEKTRAFLLMRMTVIPFVMFFVSVVIE